MFAIFDGLIFPSNNQNFFYKLIKKLLILSKPKFRCGPARAVFIEKNIIYLRRVFKSNFSDQ
jgi:hypothetical protein